MQKRKLIIIVFVVVIFFVAISLIIFAMAKTNQSRQEEKVEIAKNENNAFVVSSSLEDLVGGSYIGESFEVSYLDSQKMFYIKITRNPFSENSKKAFEWFSNKNVDITKTPHSCAVSRDVNVTEEELEKCSEYKK